MNNVGLLTGSQLTIVKIDIFQISSYSCFSIYFPGITIDILRHPCGCWVQLTILFGKQARWPIGTMANSAQASMLSLGKNWATSSVYIIDLKLIIQFRSLWSH